MIKRISAYVLCCFLVACSSSSNYEKQLVGNKFRFQVEVDTTAPQHEIVQSMLVNAGVEMDFKEEGKMLYTVNMNGSNVEQVYNWRVSNDTLITTYLTGQTTTYKIVKAEGDQIFMVRDGVNIILKKVS